MHNAHPTISTVPHIISINHADMLTVVSEPLGMRRRRGTYVPVWEIAGHGDTERGGRCHMW